MTEQRKRRLEKIPVRILVVAVTILVGILSTAYGYYGSSEGVLYAGLVVTAAGVLNAVVLSLIMPEPRGLTGRRR